MNVNIKTVHFSISDKLEEFTTKKVSKITAKHEDIVSTDVILKLIKPETQENKEVEIRIAVPGVEFFAKKVADTFEEAIDLTLEAVKKQLAKRKEKIQAHK